ncbi:MAG: hypothetical protein ACKOTB_14510, partial [Planctomycetia bacterium]
PLARTLVCRTFSDCTTAPRHGLRSGCYPLDDAYGALAPDAAALKLAKPRRGSSPMDDAAGTRGGGDA